MVTILDEIIQKLKDNPFTIGVKDIRDTYSTKEPIYPMITVEEITNRPFLQVLDDEMLSTIAYRLEIYARDISHESNLYTKRQVTTILSKEIDSLMKTNYGFRRVGDPQTLPYGSDNSIIRYIVTYGGKIENETMIIYQ